MTQRNCRFTIRIPCGQSDIRHDEDCGCQLYRSNVWATDPAVAREMAQQEAQELGGEQIGSLREDADEGTR